ncbi:Cof-type HAD-IIB family hydrolase [Pectinatus haikarae]|uniref:Cof subfamily protein (Haloacid dehalogenase superfamily) n=1 Tax=Pectinatus haikarae TaxID=349096 RepID=A0ABT9Y819_9FIRM|nr:Cof-type HAD-IIB family hydrolase [Pectinatus haikarae]MDQ0203975.1 Cof subfamily protein (haloacid dehalogenase superfamily) [Pectinatus haikarae]
MPIKLIVTDLDGTLLNEEKLVSRANIEAFHIARKNGIAASIATGRMHLAAAFFGREIGAQVPVISCNGAMIRSIDTDEKIYEKYIDDDAAAEILAFLIKNNIYCSWYIGKNRFAPYFSWDMFSGYHTVKNFDLIEVGNNYKAYTKNVTQIVLRSSTDRLPAYIIRHLQEYFSGAVKLQQNTGYTIDVTPPDINKAVGLKYLADYLGIAKEDILVFGDGDNDIAMLEYAGISIATANAIPAAKKAASFITDDCNNDGVAKGISKVLSAAFPK